MEDKFGSKVCRLNKAFYELKQSLRASFDKFTKFINNEGYFQAQSNHTLFVKFSNNSNLAILIMYVNNIIITRDNHEEIKMLRRKLSKELEIKYLGELHYFLGMEVLRSKKGIFVSQQKYVIDLLRKNRHEWV